MLGPSSAGARQVFGDKKIDSSPAASLIPPCHPKPSTNKKSAIINKS